MNWSKVWFAISLLGVASLIFALGYAVGNRVWYSMQSPLNLSVRQWNGAQLTDLSLIQTTSIYARTSENDIKTVGNVSFVAKDNETAVLFDINQMPVSFNTQDKQFVTPQQLRMYAVKKTSTGNSYEAENIGVVSFVQEERVLKGRFSSILNQSASNIERFLFLSPSGNSELPPATSLTFLPVEEQLRNAPYAWSETLVSAR